MSGNQFGAKKKIRNTSCDFCEKLAKHKFKNEFYCDACLNKDCKDYILDAQYRAMNRSREIII